MQADQIRVRLSRGGFERMRADTLPCDLWIRRADPLIAVCLAVNAAAFRGRPEAFDGLLSSVAESLSIQFSSGCRILGLILTDDISADRILASGRNPVWLVDESGNLVIFDNQPGEFFGLEQLLNGKKPDKRKTGIGSARRLNGNSFFPWVTVVLAAVNILIQLIVAVQNQSMGGSFFLESGPSPLLNRMVLPVRLFTGGEVPYERLLTAAFSHYGWQHLINNMVVLLFLGKTAEQYAGRWYFLISYLVSAVGSNAASVIWYCSRNELQVTTAGASGAVFSIAGLLLVLLAASGGKIRGIHPRQIILMMVFTVFHGMAEQGINNCAHIAGALIGMAFGLILVLKWNMDRRKQLHGADTGEEKNAFTVTDGK